MASTNTKILVLDSGVGGLSVLNEICRQIPSLRYDYLADYAFLPYGGKGESELEQRIELLLKYLDVERKYSAIVIACNSASTVVLDYLREKFQVPFIGVVPAIKVAAELTENRVIGLLATKGTVERSYTQRLIDDHAQQCRVVKLAAPSLVALAETKFMNGNLDINHLNEVIEPLIIESVDTCVLGCTHFTWIQNELQQAAPDIRWIDSCDAIARRVKFVLQNQVTKARIDKKNASSSVFMSTCDLTSELSLAVESHALGFDKVISVRF